jgi:hypothetical protein
MADLRPFDDDDPASFKLSDDVEVEEVSLEEGLKACDVVLRTAWDWARLGVEEDEAAALALAVRLVVAVALVVAVPAPAVRVLVGMFGGAILVSSFAMSDCEAVLVWPGRDEDGAPAVGVVALGLAMSRLAICRERAAREAILTMSTNPQIFREKG